MSYTQYLADPALHTRFSVCLLGPPGYGKTPLAKSTAAYLAAAYQGKFYDTPPERCYFIQANSVDALRACQHVLKEWTPLFLDEFIPGDRQQSRLGENGLKILTDVPQGGTLRIMYGSLIFPAFCPRLFAANATSAEEWLDRLGTNPLHRDAVLKRTLFFTLDSPLVTQGTVREANLEELRAALPAGMQFLEQRGALHDRNRGI